jgi:hypothetical protein
MDLRDPVIEGQSLSELVGRLTSDARDVASAEIALAKAKLGDAASRYKSAALFFGVAAALGFAALIAMLVGLIETLATLIGPGFATLAVTAGTLIVAGVLAMIGRSRLSGGSGK